MLKFQISASCRDTKSCVSMLIFRIDFRDNKKRKHKFNNGLIINIYISKNNNSIIEIDWMKINLMIDVAVIFFYHWLNQIN